MVGLQGGFTKYCFFFCLLYSRYTKNHYASKNLLKRIDFVVNQMLNENLLFLKRMWTFHQLGLTKNCVKAIMDKSGEGFLNLWTMNAMNLLPGKDYQHGCFWRRKFQEFWAIIKLGRPRFSWKTCIKNDGVKILLAFSFRFF